MKERVRLIIAIIRGKLYYRGGTGRTRFAYNDNRRVSDINPLTVRLDLSLPPPRRPPTSGAAPLAANRYVKIESLRHSIKYSSKTERVKTGGHFAKLRNQVAFIHIPRSFPAPPLHGGIAKDVAETLRNVLAASPRRHARRNHLRDA